MDKTENDMTLKLFKVSQATKIAHTQPLDFNKKGQTCIASFGQQRVLHAEGLKSKSSSGSSRSRIAKIKSMEGEGEKIGRSSLGLGFFPVPGIPLHL